jgi:uncharacterized protein YxjI
MQQIAAKIGINKYWFKSTINYQVIVIYAALSKVVIKGCISFIQVVGIYLRRRSRYTV